MHIVDFETAVTEFLALGHRIQAERGLTGDRIVDQFVDWYRGTRIHEASVFDDNDMLILGWGGRRPMELPKPINFRALSRYEGIGYEETVYHSIELLRQVVPTGGLEDANFDDVAVEMTVLLCFDPFDGNEPSGAIDVWSPDDIDMDLTLFRGEPYVQRLLPLQPARIVVWIEGAG